MIISMTGYGKASVINEGVTIETEVKSVNSRFLEVSVKLPSSIQNKEYELKEFIRTKLKRGKIHVNIILKSSNEVDSFLALNSDKLIKVINDIGEIKKLIKSKEKIKISHILKFNDLFAPQGDETVEQSFNAIKKVLNDAIENLIQMRSAEGKELYKDLIFRIDIIKKYIDDIEGSFKDNLNEYFLKLKDRIKLLVQDISNYNDRLELELALLSDKSDITEECIRLKSHLNFFIETINNGNEAGRRLNFLCQEMLREANTISAKSISSEVSHKTVLIKEEIERIREQIQNIE